MDKFELMGGRLHLYKRPKSRFWQCYTYLAGRPWRESTKQENPALAQQFAEDWYLSLKGKDRVGELKAGKTFRFVAEQFLKEYEILTEGMRSPEWVELLKQKLDKYLIPYFGPEVVSAITPGMVQEYRIHFVPMTMQRCYIYYTVAVTALRPSNILPVVRTTTGHDLRHT